MMTGDVQVLTLKLCGQTFGIEACKIHSICPPSPIYKIPLSPPCVFGCSNVRGNIVTMIDMKQKMKYPTRDDDNYFNIVIKYNGDLYGLMFDSVMDVLWVNMNNLQKADKSLYDGVLKGVYLNAQTPIMIIDPNLFFGGLNFS